MGKTSNGHAPPFTIDPDFSGLIPPLTDAEFAQLEANMLEDGCTEPLTLWANHDILLDGHHRFKICEKHNIGFKTRALRFETKEDAKQWCRRQHVGRRNLTPEQEAYERGQLYNATKQEHGGDRKGTGNTGKTGSESSGHNDHLKTAEQIAAEHGVTERTVRRDGEFAEHVDAIAEDAPEVAEAALSGKATRADVATVAKLPKKKRKAVAARVKSGKAKSVKEAIAQATIEEESKEVPEPTTADECEADNKAIESFCRALVKFYEDGVPHTHWTDAEGRSASALASVKAACATLRAAKSVICPACEDGEAKGKKCVYCAGEGYLPKHKADQVARVA